MLSEQLQLGDFVAFILYTYIFCNSISAVTETTFWHIICTNKNKYIFNATVTNVVSMSHVPTEQAKQFIVQAWIEHSMSFNNVFKLGLFMRLQISNALQSSQFKNRSRSSLNFLNIISQTSQQLLVQAWCVSFNAWFIYLTNPSDTSF